MKLRNIIFSILLYMGADFSVSSQSTFYDLDSIHEIRIYFSIPNWDEVLDSLYVNGDEGRLLANVSIDGHFYNDVGVRYKGFSSFSTNRKKNPFNLDLDYTIGSQEHEGFNKFKLSNVIQDPSFVREVLSYEITRKYMPASRANYANVYVNDTLNGLYTSIESVNKRFLENHYQSNENAFFKGNPENLDLNGENSNLSNSPGILAENYYPYYNLKSDDTNHWNDLKALIDNLNDTTQEIENVLNVDRTLWMHALNYTLVNFDSYVGYAQNYYLYKDESGRFNPILWDLNMSFGSYRLSDASDNWDGFSITEAKTIDPLAHYNSISVQPRPLLRNLFVNSTYRRMYLAHIRTILDENFTNQDYMQRATAIQNAIATSVALDTNKFYSTLDFNQNLTSTVSDFVDYPGIADLMDERTTYLTNYPGVQGSPSFSNPTFSPSNPIAGEEIYFSVAVNHLNADVFLAYRQSKSKAFSYSLMLDDGTMQDGAPNDGIFGTKIQNAPNLIEYYFYAQNDSSGRFLPERAAYEFFSIAPKLASKAFSINEVMAANTFMNLDNFNEYEDWIEFLNTATYSISTDEMYFSNDRTNLVKWKLPLQTIGSGTYFILWADEDGSQGKNHLPFKLASEGGSLWLSYSDSTILDSLVYNQQYKYSSIGRFPNGTGDFIELAPTFMEANSESNLPVHKNLIFIYPNPAANEIIIRFNEDLETKITLFNLDGREVIANFSHQGLGEISLNSSAFLNGIYLLNFEYGSTKITHKIIINK